VSPGTSAPEAVDLLGTLGQAGVQLWEETGRLRYRAPAGALTPGLRQALSDRRDEVLERLRRDAEPLVPDPAAPHDPFPLTDVQSTCSVVAARSPTAASVATGTASWSSTIWIRTA
jgi:hypothetical protein